VTAEAITFLAHFTNTPLPAILEMSVKQINYWYDEAHALYIKMNKSKDE
jgi:hypothetical protein